MIWLALAGLALRLGYAWYGNAATAGVLHSHSYQWIAASLLDRGEYAMFPGQPTSYTEPAYPLFIAAVYALFGRHNAAVIVVQCVLGTATAWLLYRLAARLFGERVGRAAGLVLLFYPPAIYYSAYIWRETLMTFLATLLALLSATWREKDGGGRDWGAGACGAALAMCNSAMLFATLLSGLAFSRMSPRRSVAYWVPIAAALLLWTGRNWAVHGRFVPGSTHGGEEFYQAQLVPAGDLGTPRQNEIMAADPFFARAVKLPEARANAALVSAALSWIGTHPGLYARRVAARLVKLWRLWPYPRSYNHSYAVLVLVSLLSDGWIVPLGFYGLWLFRRRWREAPAVPCLILGLTLLYALVHAVIRYRVPVMGLMIALALASADALLRRRRA